MTEECNFNCAYCYQKKGKRYCDTETIESALEFFAPFFSEDCYINFYGGEPLLAFDKIQHAVDYIERNLKEKSKTIHYALTTNGSLIDEKILQFFEQNTFAILLSFDGLAQEIFRKKGSFEPTVAIIEQLLKSPHIEVETNSVFTPESVSLLAQSMRFVIELGIPNCHLALSSISPWDDASLSLLRKELSLLREFLVSFYRDNKSVPVREFRKSPEGIFGCLAGKDRMTLAPDGKLWGCFLIWDYFNRSRDVRAHEKYCFGDLALFKKDYEKVYPRILSNHSNLRMDHFYTSDGFCMMCEDLKECAVCPMDAAFSSEIISKIPDRICRIKRLIREEKKLFWQEIKKSSLPGS